MIGAVTGKIDILMRLFMFRGPFIAALVILMPACDRSDQQIKVYRVSKAPLEESEPQQQNAMPTNAGSPAAPHRMPPVASTTPTTPPNWEPQPLSQMRQASFLVKGDNGAVADISFVSLGAAAGNVLDNVNRWLDQLGQPPITEQKLADIDQRLRTSLGDVTIVDLAGLPENADPARDGRIIAAMVTTDKLDALFQNAWQRRSHRGAERRLHQMGRCDLQRPD